MSESRKLQAALVVPFLAVLLTGPAAAQQCVDPAPDLLSWWPAEGNAEDVWDGNDGTLVNATFSPGR